MNRTSAFSTPSNSLPGIVRPPTSLISAKITDLWKRLVPIEFSDTIGKTNVNQVFVYLGIALASTLITYIAMRHYHAAEREKQAQELKNTKESLNTQTAENKKLTQELKTAREALNAQVAKNKKQAQELNTTKADLNELREPVQTIIDQVKVALLQCGNTEKRLESHVGKSETMEVPENPILEDLSKETEKKSLE